MCGIYRIDNLEFVTIVYTMCFIFLYQRSGEVTGHVPEVILNNFNTRLGRTFARMFASLFPHDPEFHGRRAVTFHNQRDFIFFRQHRYVMSDML